MSDTQDLLSSLQRRGIRLWVNDGRLHFNAPKGALSAEELNQLRAQREQLIDSLEYGELRRGTPSSTRPRESLLPLTALQMRRWKYLVASASGLSERTCLVAQQVSGQLNVELLRRSLQHLVHRHEALRSRIVLLNGVPHQTVDAEREIPWQVIRLPATDATNPLAGLAQLVERFVREKSDLRAGSAIAARLFSVSPQEHALVVALDHMFADAVSCQVIARELWSVYHALLRQLPTPLPTLTLQFPDYVAWMHRTHRSWMKAHAEYWLTRLTNLPAMTLPGTAPSEREAPISQTVTFEFDGHLTAWLRNFARRERTLLPLATMAIYVASLARWLRQRDFLVAFVSNARDRPELQSMVGFLADYLHLRVAVEPPDSFVELAKRIDQEFRRAYEHQDYGRVPDLIPVCLPELGFNWVPGTLEQLPVEVATGSADILTVQPLQLQLAFPLLPPRKLSVQFLESDVAIMASVAYRPDVLSAAAVECFVDGMRQLAYRIMENPDAPIYP